MTLRETALKQFEDPIRSRSLWFESAGVCRLRTEDLAVTGEREVTVRALYTGISRGTEALVFNGMVPVSEFERMRAPHQSGNFPFPVKYGYASVGIVEEGPSDLKGSTVFCLHPHQDHFRTVLADLHVVPDKFPAGRAVLAANMETALNIVWDAAIQPGDRVAVFGAGVVGLLAAYISAKILGTDTVICDTNAERAMIAAKLGIAFSSPQNVPQDCDVLINASASPQALSHAIDHAGFEARIVEASWYGERTAEIPLGGAFHAKRLCIVSSQVGSISPLRRSRWNFKRRLAKAIQLLGDDRLDHLISGETAFETIAEDYPGIIASRDTLCHRIRY